MNEQLAEGLKSIDTTVLPGGDLILVGIETREPDDKISFDASRTRRMKLFHSVEFTHAMDGMHRDYMLSQIRPYYIQLNGFTVKGGKLGKGSLHPYTEHRFKCASCGQLFVKSLIDERRSKAADSFFCAACGREEGELSYIGLEVPQMSENSEGVRRMAEAFEDTDWEHPTETADVVPQVMAIFDGAAPTLWVPETPLEELAAERLEERNQFMLPYRLASRVDAPAIGAICLARPSAAGWVSSKYFDQAKKDGDQPKDRFNPGFKQHLPARRRWGTNKPAADLSV